MHTKLKFAILAAFSAAAFAAAPVHAAYSVYSDPDCGPKVESSAWFIDYSGTMQEKLREPEEKSYPDWAKGKEKEYDALYDYRKVVLAKNLLLKHPQDAPDRGRDPGRRRHHGASYAPRRL